MNWDTIIGIGGIIVIISLIGLNLTEENERTSMIIGIPFFIFMFGAAFYMGVFLFYKRWESENILTQLFTGGLGAIFLYGFGYTIYTIGLYLKDWLKKDDKLTKYEEEE
jgi:hypothetical protein